MPYASNADLPNSVRDHFSSAAQTIYRKAFNRAWDSNGAHLRQEQIAHRIAWAAVKRRYCKMVMFGSSASRERLRVGSSGLGAERSYIAALGEPMDPTG